MKADIPGKPGFNFGDAVMVPVRFAMELIDPPLRWLQRTAGLGGMATFFLLPNMLIFGIFVLLPFFINFAYSMTGGAALFLPDRNFVGTDQYARLFDCSNYLDPKQLRRRHILDSRRQYRVVCPPPGNADDRRFTGDRSDPQSRPQGAQFLACSVLLSGAAVAGGGRPHLEMDPAAPGPSEFRSLRPRLRTPCLAERP